MSSELCRAIAHEAIRRGAHANPDELWAVLSMLGERDTGTVIDIGSGTPVLWGWWSVGARVVGVPWPGLTGGNPFGAQRLPEAVTALAGDPRERSTVMRVGDQLGAFRADVLVLSGFADYDELRAAVTGYGTFIRDGGLILLHGIEDPAVPGTQRLWRELVDGDEMVARVNPVGFGIVTIKERTASHG